MSVSAEHTKDAKRELPDGWRWAKLREVADVVNGFGFAESLQGRTDLPYPFIKVSDMNAPGAEIVIEKAANTVDDEILRYLGARCYPQGTVVFPKVGGALLTNKKRVLGRDSSFDNNIMGVVPRHADGAFLYYWLCTVDLAAHANTQALPSIRQSLVASFDIPLPPLPEQRRIAGLLKEQITAVEKARAAAHARLEAVKALPDAFLRQVFPQPGQPLPDGWRWIKLREVCELNPRRPSIDRNDSDPTSFIPMEAVDAISGLVSDLRVRQYGEVKKGYTYFAEGDVLFAKITPCMQNGKHTIAKGLIGGIGFGTTEFHVLRPNENIISEVIWFFIRQPNVLIEATEHFTGAVGQQRLPDDYLANLEIPLPPLAEQRRLAGVLREQMAAVEKARAAVENELNTINALPAALLCRAFNGEI